MKKEKKMHFCVEIYEVHSSKYNIPEKCGLKEAIESYEDGESEAIDNSTSYIQVDEERSHTLREAIITGNDPELLKMLENEGFPGVELDEEVPGLRAITLSKNDSNDKKVT